MIKRTLTSLIQVRDWLEPAGTKIQDRSLAMPRTGPFNPKPDDDSATENSDDEHLIPKRVPMPTMPPIACVPAPVDKKMDHSTPGPDLPREPQKPAEKSARSDSSSGSAGPPSKKARQAVSGSSDSDESDRAVAGPSTRRGARQPIKRGGRRF